jgi:large subunit ribosomal protein L13
VLGRLASRAARLLQGKHKPTWLPYLDRGDHVIVINAARVRLTGRKDEQKIYRQHSVAAAFGGTGGRRARQPIRSSRKRSAACCRKTKSTRDVSQVEGPGRGSPHVAQQQTRGSVTTTQYYGTAAARSTARVFLRPGLAPRSIAGRS